MAHDEILKEMAVLERTFNEVAADSVEKVKQRDALNVALVQAQSRMTELRGQYTGLKKALDILAPGTSDAQARALAAVAAAPLPEVAATDGIPHAEA